MQAIAPAPLAVDEDLAIRIDDLTLAYDRHPAVHHLSLAVPRGALVAVLGPNGAGKSSLLKAIAGLMLPLEGAISLAADLAGHVGYLPQAAEIDRSFPISVLDFASLGLWRAVGALRGHTRAERDRVAAALAAVGLAGFERRPIGTLSGGQMQRLLFARLMLEDAQLLLLDEPFAALDQHTMADLVAIIRRWQGEGRTILAVMHDIALARATCPHALLLARHLVAFGPTANVVTPQNLSATRAMPEAFDAAAAICTRSA